MQEKSAAAEFRVLGPLEVRVRGTAGPLGGPKARALLADLLVNRREALSVDRLIDDLWGDQTPATARQSVHAHVARLRRLLADNGGAVLGNDGRGYVLRLDDD